MSGRFSKFLPYLAAVMTAVITGRLLLQDLGLFGKINDLPEYYAAARLILSGNGFAVYKLETLFGLQVAYFPDLKRGVALFLPPPAVPLLYPIGLLPPEIAPAVWMAFLVLMLLLSIVLIKIWLRLSVQATAWLCSVLWFCGPAYESIRIGQLAPILMAVLLTGTMLASANRVIPAAICFALFVLKPQQILPLIAFMIGAGRWRLLIGIACAVAVLCGLAYFEMGSVAFTDYMRLITDPASLQYMQPQLNPTVRGQLMRILGQDNPAATACGAIAMLGALVFAILLGRRMRQCRDWLAAGLIAVMPLGLVTSMHCHDYDMLLLVPGLVAFFALPIGKRLAEWGYVVWAALFGLFLMPFSIPIQYDYLLKGGLINPGFLVLAAWSMFAAIMTWRHKDDFLSPDNPHALSASDSESES